MDDYVYDILSKLKLKGVKLIRLKEVEDKQLLRVKRGRSETEYCWTVKPALIYYIFEKHREIKEILYLDSDIYIFSNPSLFFKIVSKYDIAITPHSFPDSMSSRTTNTGLFNAGTVYFKRSGQGAVCLKRWRQQCIDWCFHRLEDGKLGDQMYLNEWPKKYSSLIELSDPRINLAPWNVTSHEISYSKASGVMVNGGPLMLYHFHQFKIVENEAFDLSFGYSIPLDVEKTIYKQYIDEILVAMRVVMNIDSNFRFGIERSHLKVSIRGGLVKLLGPFVWRIKSLLKKF